MSAIEKTINPIGQVQKEIADILRSSDFFKSHRIDVIEQNKQGLKFLLQKTVAQIKGVVVVVGIDSFTNDYPALEMEITVSATENVVQNRVSDSSVTAIDVIQAAIEKVDGEWWHFEECRHEAPADGILQATATFKGLVKRVNEITANENKE